jgi:hypothetical protein
MRIRRQRVQVIIGVLAVVLTASACADVDQGGATSGSLVLTQRGLGPFEVGDPFQVVSDQLVQVFGGPDADSDNPTSTVYVPTCGGQTDRLQSWGNFIVMFTGSPNDLRLASWTYGFDPITGSGEDVRRLNLLTDEGIGLGSTRGEVERAYGAEASFTDAPELDSVLVTLGNEGGSHISGRLEPDVVLLELEPTCE